MNAGFRVTRHDPVAVPTTFPCPAMNQFMLDSGYRVSGQIENRYADQGKDDPFSLHLFFRTNAKELATPLRDSVETEGKA